MMDQLIKTFEWLTHAYLFCGTNSNVSVDPLGQKTNFQRPATAAFGTGQDTRGSLVDFFLPNL